MLISDNPGLFKIESLLSLFSYSSVVLKNEIVLLFKSSNFDSKSFIFCSSFSVEFNFLILFGFSIRLLLMLLLSLFICVSLKLSIIDIFLFFIGVASTSSLLYLYINYIYNKSII